MDENRVDHLRRQLRAWEVDGLAASALEACRPLSVFGAQALYFAQPFLAPFVSESDLTALAQWLDDPDTLPGLAHRLTEEAQ